MTLDLAQQKKTGLSKFSSKMVRTCAASLMTSLPLLAFTASLGVAIPAGIAMTTVGSQPLQAATASDKRFRQWVERLWPSARRKGVSRAIFNRAFRGVQPDPEVIRAAHYQPEFVRPVWDYMASAASDKRVETGLQMLQQHEALLDRIEKQLQSRSLCRYCHLGHGKQLWSQSRPQKCHPVSRHPLPIATAAAAALVANNFWPPCASCNMVISAPVR